MRRLPITALALLSTFAIGQAQQTAPIPLYSNPPPSSIEPEPLPPIAPAPSMAPSAPATVATPAGTPLPATADAPSPPSERVFCGQSVSARVAAPEAIPERYRRFIGIFSDASWTPVLCGALVVERVTPDGIATIVYAFGPMGSNAPGPGGVLHGTGVIRDGELRFQNSDGSQFAFRPLYADLAGSLTMPQGQTYQAVFKRTP